MHPLLKLLFVPIAAMLPLPALAALSIFATVPEWGALAQELGGSAVDVYVATNALQDPHHVEAKPSLIARARKADLVISTGAELEVGWLPLVLQQAGNPKVLPGRPGYFEASAFVTTIERPTRLDRADGDVHPLGNPHIQTDPRNIARVAAALSARMAELDPADAAMFRERYTAFDTRWRASIARWQAQAERLRGVPVIVQHKAFSYLLEWLGMKETAALEPKPGVEPTAASLSEILALQQRQPAKMVIRAAYQSDRASQWMAERAHIPAVALPFTVGGDASARDLTSMFDDTIARLVSAAGGGPFNERHRRLHSLAALVAGLLVTATHVPLGMQVLARGIVFIDLAIAQIAGCGVILADRLGFDAAGASAQVAALLAAIAGALLLTWTERRWPDVQEAIIGVVFVLAATAGVLLLAGNVHGSEHLRDLLVGQILWVQPRHLLIAGAVYTAVLALWIGARARLGRTGFYLLFACVVTLSVQLVGLYLVFATLIVPPLATRHRVRRRLVSALLVGMAGYVSGIALSAALDVPTGPLIVWALVAAGIIAYAVAPSARVAPAVAR